MISAMAFFWSRSKQGMDFNFSILVFILFSMSGIVSLEVRRVTDPGKLKILSRIKGRTVPVNSSFPILNEIINNLCICFHSISYHGLNTVRNDII